MAECQNVVTPRMIKKGQVNIGDKIDLEEEAVLVHGPAPVRMNNMNSMNNNSSERRMLSYENMTPYMNNTASSGTLENPSVILPQSQLKILNIPILYTFLIYIKSVHQNILIIFHNIL